MLQYVPGLGPRKAGALIKALQMRSAMGKAIESRQALRDENVLPPNVWHNAVGLISFDTRAEPHRPPGLEGCRIHPEQYTNAMKICFDGIFDDDEEIREEDEEEKQHEAVEIAMGPEALNKESRPPLTPSPSPSPSPSP